MENALLQAIQNKVTSWRDEDYKGVKKETLNILKHIKRIGYLYKPQIEALETYIYLKEILGNKPTVEIAKSIFDNELELIKSLGISEKQALELAYTSDKQERIEKLLHARYNS